jgi:leucyl-tRNA synthetase
MPQWAGSSWYYLRYMDTKNTKTLVGADMEKYWAPVDLYVGGAEHATRHLIYARFWHKFLYDIGIVSTIEPFIKLQNVGLIMGEDGRKMSKRFGNVVNPDDVVKTYGADTLRIYEMFMGPFEQQISWSTESMIGSRRFIERVWKMSSNINSKNAQNDISDIGKTADRFIHKAIKKVTEDISKLSFNTAISALMITVNELEKIEIRKDQFESFLKLLAPFAPHMTEELWVYLGNKNSIHLNSWPTFDANLATDSVVKIAVQVNGKIRATFEIDSQQSKDDEILKITAMALPEVKKWIENQTIKKTIVIKGKLVSIVI